MSTPDLTSGMDRRDFLKITTTASAGLSMGFFVPQSAQAAATPQLSLFTEYLEHPAIAELRTLDMNALTPLAAFDLLRRLADSTRT